MWSDYSAFTSAMSNFSVLCDWQVHDVKFQAQTAEEKEAWIKAVSDAISRAKNKVFDEVNICVTLHRIIIKCLIISANDILNEFYTSKTIQRSN